jgi:hypothetical protein
MQIKLIIINPLAPICTQMIKNTPLVSHKGIRVKCSSINKKKFRQKFKILPRLAGSGIIIIINKICYIKKRIFNITKKSIKLANIELCLIRPKMI